MRSDKTHGHKPRRHIKLLLFLTGCGSGSLSLSPGTPQLSSLSIFLSPTQYACHTRIGRSSVRSSFFLLLAPLSIYLSQSLSFPLSPSSLSSLFSFSSPRAALKRGLVAYHAGYLSPAFRRASCLRPPTRRPDALPYYSIRFSHCHGHGFSRTLDTYIHARSLFLPLSR